MCLKASPGCLNKTVEGVLLPELSVPFSDGPVCPRLPEAPRQALNPEATRFPHVCPWAVLRGLCNLLKMFLIRKI